MKRSLRALLLLVGLVGTFAYAAVPRDPPRSGPMPLCPPSHPRCDAEPHDLQSYLSKMT
jgi:hypothetical protein